LQGAVDAAALAAAGDPANAGIIVARVLTDNGYAQTATITTGAYTPDPGVAVANRLDTTPSAQKNAVRVTETVSVRGYLASIFGGAMLSNVVATATAAQTPVVSFSAGTGLASITNGQLNAVLGGLLGTNLSLSLVNYQALASTNVDALTFLDQLATLANATAGTYGDLANTNVTMGQMMAAAQAALNIHPSGNNSAALDALNVLALQTPAGVSSTTGNIVDTSVWQKRQIGSIAQQTPGQVTFNLFDLTSAMARAYGSGHLLDLGSTLTVPVTNTSVSTQLSLGAPMASAALANVGTSITTAQAHLAITATVLQVPLGLAPVTVSLPLFLTLATGTATVAAIPCQTGGVMTTISAASQAGLIQVGTVSNADFVDFSKIPAAQPANIATVKVSILGLGLVSVAITGSGSTLIGGASGASMDFTQGDIDAGTVREAAGSTAGTVFSGLAPHITLGLSPNTGVVSSLINSTVLPVLNPLLTSILQNLDQPTDTLLRSLGLRLGVIDVVVHGVRCGTPTLVT
jgi:uncharacterized membrane protein